MDRPDPASLALASAAIALVLTRLVLGRLVRLLLRPRERAR